MNARPELPHDETEARARLALDAMEAALEAPFSMQRPRLRFLPDQPRAAPPPCPPSPPPISRRSQLSARGAFSGLDLAFIAACAFLAGGAFALVLWS